MQTAPPNYGLLFFEKLHGSIEDKFPCRYFLGRVKNTERHGGRNVMPRCLSEGVDIFLKSVERQGESGHDVRVSQAMCAWLLAHMDGACRRPRHDENHCITFH